MGNAESLPNLPEKVKRIGGGNSAETAASGADAIGSFRFEKNTCALSYWQPIKLLEEGSISDIHLCVRRRKPIRVRYKDKRDVMSWAKKHPNENPPNGEKVSNKDDEQLYVLKSIMKDHVGDERVMEEMRSEIYTMSKLDHPNVVRLCEAYERRRHIYLVLEYCSKGNLADRKFSEDDAAVIARKILSAVAYLHSRGVVHRDLKLENCMLDGEGELKIIDFGLATKYLSDEYKVMTDKVGTLYSMAPQVLQGKYSKECDLWSIGVITYLLLSKGKQPFWGPPKTIRWARRRKVMIDRIMRCQYQRMEGPRWEAVSSDAKDFVKSLLQMDPDDRPTAEEALEHSWIKQNGYPSEDVGSVVSYDEQAELRSDFRYKIWSELATKLTFPDIELLQIALESNDEEGDGLIKIEAFRSILENDTALSKEDVGALFIGERLNTTESINYVDLMVEVMRGRGRNTIDDLARALDDLDAEGKRKVLADKLKSVLKLHLPEEVEKDLWSEVDIDSDRMVSSVQVLEFVGKTVAKRQRDSIRTASTGEDVDADHDDLVDETNAIIPGGRHTSSDGSAKYVYKTERKQMQKA